MAATLTEVNNGGATPVRPFVDAPQRLELFDTMSWEEEDGEVDRGTEEGEQNVSEQPAARSPQPQPDGGHNMAAGHASLEDGDADDGKGATKKAWQVVECVAAALAVLAANRETPNQHQVVRAESAQRYCPKFLGDSIARGMEVKGCSVEQSTALRTPFVRTGRNKGKSGLYSKFAELTKVAQNDLLPLLSRELGPDKKPPSGKSWAEVLKAAKEKWWEKWSSARKTKAGKPMPECWVEVNWEVFLLLGPTPGAKHFPDFCFGALSQGNGPACGRESAREREAQRKKRQRDADRVAAGKELVAEKENKDPWSGMFARPSATAAALQQNNKIWSVQLLLKYGDAEQKAKAMKYLEKTLSEDVDIPTHAGLRDGEGIVAGSATYSVEAGEDENVIV